MGLLDIATKQYRVSFASPRNTSGYKIVCVVKDNFILWDAVTHGNILRRRGFIEKRNEHKRTSGRIKRGAVAPAYTFLLNIYVNWRSALTWLYSRVLGCEGLIIMTSVSVDNDVRNSLLHRVVPTRCIIIADLTFLMLYPTCLPPRYVLTLCMYLEYT